MKKSVLRERALEILRRADGDAKILREIGVIDTKAKELQANLALERLRQRQKASHELLRRAN